MTLTDPERRALRLSSRKDGAEIAAHFTRLTKHQIGPTVAARLQHRRLITIKGTAAHITPAGTKALTAPIPDTPRLMHRNPASTKPYTTNPALGLSDEPEPVDAATLERIVERKLMTAEQLRLAQLEQARAHQQAALEALEPLAAEDKRVADRARLIRRSIAAIDMIVRKAA